MTADPTPRVTRLAQVWQYNAHLAWPYLRRNGHYSCLDHLPDDFLGHIINPPNDYQPGPAPIQFTLRRLANFAWGVVMEHVVAEGITVACGDHRLITMEEKVNHLAARYSSTPPPQKAKEPIY